MLASSRALPGPRPTVSGKTLPYSRVPQSTALAIEGLPLSVADANALESDQDLVNTSEPVPVPVQLGDGRIMDSDSAASVSFFSLCEVFD